MVANNILQEPSIKEEATAYLNTVLCFSAIFLILLLVINRKWCYSTVFGNHNHEKVLEVKTACIPIDNAQIDVLGKPYYYPERVFAFEAADSEDELRLQIQQVNDSIGCHYEEKNENVRPTKPIEVDVIERSLRETTLRESTSYESYLRDPIQESNLRESRIDEYRHTLETQSSVESDALAHNDTSLLCSANGEETSGTIEVSLLYDAPVRCMTVHILQARDLPGHSTEHPLHSQARVLLLPSKKQKFKTKIRYGEHPQFMESFVFHKINPEDVHGVAVRVRIYACSRVRRVRPLAEAVLRLAELNLDVENSMWLLLTPKYNQRQALGGGNSTPSGASTTPSCSKRETPDAPISVIGWPTNVGRRETIDCLQSIGKRDKTDGVSLARSDSASSCGSTRSAAPELLLGLAYNAHTAHLSVEVIKGTHFRKLSGSKSPDTYVKLCLVSSLGQEMARGKSSTRRARSNPLFKELFIFQVALYQLSEVTLCVSVWCRRNVKRNEMVGWCSLGLNPSGRQAAEHWEHACAARGLQVQRWHALRDS